MNSTTMTHGDVLLNLTQSLRFNFPPKLPSFRPPVRRIPHKSLSYSQIIEICFLVFILIEHTFIFLLTFQKKSPKRPRQDETPRSLLLPSKSFLYSCLHRNWMRIFSFSNICLSLVYFLLLMLKHYHPNLVHYSSITFYSLPLNLLQHILINFSTFHLFIISIVVLQYFIRYYRLLKNTYSSYFFNGQSLLLTRHTNVALILSGSLALIFAYNFIFYTPQYPHTLSLLPLITFNMLLLPLINLIIFSFIIICFIINYYYKSDHEHISVDNEQENLRLIIEKNTCIKCYSRILQENQGLFQDKNYPYRNLYENFFSKHLRSSYPFQIKRNYFTKNNKNYSQTDFYEEQNNLESHSVNNLFYQTTVIKLHQQHSLCHLSYLLLLIFLFKYILLTFPQYVFQMLFHLQQFYHFTIKRNLTYNLTYSLYENNQNLVKIFHYLFLLSRFGDSILLVRLPYLIKKYFPCWCQFNSKLLRKQQISHQILTTKNSISSNNDPVSAGDMTNANELPSESKPQESIKKRQWQKEHRRFRLRFQFVPLWSNNRPRLFKENV